MKQTIVFAFLGLIALSSALKVTNEFYSGKASELKQPLLDVLKTIDKEKQDDLNTIEHAKAKVAAKEEDAAEELKKLTAAQKVAADAMTAWKKTQADLKTREAEYSTNDETRTSEEGKITEIHAEIKKLAQAGPTDGTIGKMPKSVLAAAKIALTDLMETAHKEKAEKAINLLQRSHAKITEISGAFGILSKDISVERKVDTSEVDAQKKVVLNAKTAYEQADSERVARQNAKDEADDRVATAKSVLAHEQEEYKKAQAIRDDDIATINKAMAAIEELIKVTEKHEAGPNGEELLQITRKSAGITKVRELIAAMKADVAKEEKFQRMMLLSVKDKYHKAVHARIAAAKNYQAAVLAFKAAEKKWIDAYGSYHRAETDLSQEIAVAEQERRTINQVREMLKKLQSAEADVLGSCPVDKIGAVCSGYGDCKTNMTDPQRTKYCSCKSGSGRTGRDCSMCKFGWKMATGELKGFCKQVYVPTVSFIQTEAGSQYSVDDLNNAVATMMQTGRHTETSSGVEELLSGLEKKLALKEAMMRKERDNVKIKHDVAEKANHAAKKHMAEMKELYKVAILAEMKLRKHYMAIYAMYKFEAPLRAQETALLTKLDNIMIKLEGGEVHTDTTLAPKEALKADNTHAPTEKAHA